jgi:hypothetical protein
MKHKYFVGAQKYIKWSKESLITLSKKESNLTLR